MLIQHLTEHKSVRPESKTSSRKFSIGTPRAELTNRWWKIFSAIPNSRNPLNPDNQGIIDDIRQTRSVHFLGGRFGVSDKPIIRNVTVAKNQAVVLPILTATADNIGWNFRALPGYENSPVPYQFSIDDLKILNDEIMDTATGVSLEVNDTLLISDANKEQFRQASRGPYDLNLPKDDIFNYRASNPKGWVKPPYNQGVQDGIWAELKNLPRGKNTIHFEGTINYSNIVVDDYNNSGGIGDTPLEFLLGYVRDNFPSSSLNVSYKVKVLSQSGFNAQL